MYELDSTDLGLPTFNITQGGLVYQNHGNYKVFFNPAVPFVYLNEFDWDTLRDAFTKKF